MTIVRRHPDIESSYDDEADVLSLSFGKPIPATGIDLDATVILRLDEQAGQVVGLTLIGLRRALAAKRAEDSELAS